METWMNAMVYWKSKDKLENMQTIKPYLTGSSSLPESLFFSTADNWKIMKMRLPLVSEPSVNISGVT